MLGFRGAATADFEHYAGWLGQQEGECWQEELARCQAGLEGLEVGENPFTPAVLAE